MSKRMYRVAALIPFLIVVVFMLTGGFYVNDSFFVGKLSIGGRYISEIDGQACLTGQDDLGPWRLSTPTISNARLQPHYLAYSLDKSNTKVYFTTERGEPTEWVFVIIRHESPRSYQNRAEGESPLREGDEGYLFFLKAKNGPYTGWYLAEGPVSKTVPGEGGRPSRPLILVEDRRQAATLHYLHRRHRPVDKREKR
jgi:hypothetical protein